MLVFGHSANLLDPYLYSTTILYANSVMTNVASLVFHCTCIMYMHRGLTFVSHFFLLTAQDVDSQYGFMLKINCNFRTMH